MKKALLILLCAGLSAPAMAQVVTTEQLSEVTVYATNYKYLNNVETGEVASIPVQMLERKVASFNLKESDFYSDEYDLYQIQFYIPEGKILAAYDKDGNILRTVERFQDITLPMTVRDAVAEGFPGWTVTKDVYVVNYHEKKGANKTYKLKLENGDETLRVKVDHMGNFL